LSLKRISPLMPPLQRAHIATVAIPAEYGPGQFDNLAEESDMFVEGRRRRLQWTPCQGPL